MRIAVATPKAPPALSWVVAAAAAEGHMGMIAMAPWNRYQRPRETRSPIKAGSGAEGLATASAGPRARGTFSARNDVERAGPANNSGRRVAGAVYPASRKKKAHINERPCTCYIFQVVLLCSRILRFSSTGGELMCVCCSLK